MKQLIYLFFTLALLSGATSCSPTGNKGKAAAKDTAQADTNTFKMPDVPPTLTDPQQKMEYVAAHFWQNYNFRDTALVSAPQTDQAFANFTAIVSSLNSGKADEAITQMLTAAAADSVVLDKFLNLSEHYMYDPNSPLRNEDLYVPVIQFILHSPKFDETEKIRPTHQLKMIRTNHVGDIATDFAYTLANGKTGRLHQLKAEYTLIFFNNPDCHDCKRVKEYMAASQLFNMLTNERKDGRPRLIILGVYPEDDMVLWGQASYPSLMLNSFNRGQTIEKQELYDLKAIPCLYLLDKDKRVLLKDATVEQVEMWLAQMMQATNGQ